VFTENSVLFTNTTKSLIWLLRMNQLKTKYNALANANLKVYRFLLPYLPYTNHWQQCTKNLTNEGD
jgi:hypothetical protein